MRIFLVFGFWGMLCLGSSYAQSFDYESDTLSLDEVQVQSTRTGGSLLRQAAALSIIRKADLEPDAGIAITSALNRLPGVYMQSGALNTNRITIRGIGSRSLFGTNKVRAYLDDIPLTGGDGETTIEDLDLSLLGKVEVLRGPASSIFGAGLGGAINLYSDHPGVDPLALSCQLQTGSYGLRRQVYRLSHSQKGSAWFVNFNDTHSDGYRDNNSYDRTSATILGRLYQEKSKTSVFASWISLKAFIPSSLDSATFAENPQAAAFSWGQLQGFEDYDKALLGISHGQQIADHISLKASVFGSFRAAYELRPFNILTENNQSLGFRTYLHFEEKSWDLKLGGEYFWENYAWQTFVQQNGQIADLLSNQQEIRRYANLFAQSDIQLATRFQLTAGLNLNQTHYDLQDRFFADSLDQSGQYRFQAQLSPRLALLYSLSPTQSCYAQLSHGFSPPSVEESLRPDGAVNSDIQPESGWNMEIGARGFLKEKFSYDVTLFHMEIRNLLVARRTDFDQFVGVNAGASTHSGLEAAFSYQFLEKKVKTQLSIFANAHLGRYRFADFVDDGEDYSGNQLTGVPAASLHAGIDFHSAPGFYARLNGQYVSAMPMRDDNSIFSEAFELLNAKAGWRKKLGKRWEMELFGGINNLLDSQYASMILPNASAFGGNAPRYYYPGLPRNYYGGMKLNLTIS